MLISMYPFVRKFMLFFPIHCFLFPNALCYGIFNFPRLLSKPSLLFLRSWKNSVWLINNENFRNCYMTLLSISSSKQAVDNAACFMLLFPFFSLHAHCAVSIRPSTMMPRTSVLGFVLLEGFTTFINLTILRQINSISWENYYDKDFPKRRRWRGANRNKIPLINFQFNWSDWILA